MEGRKQFTCYRSYYEAIGCLEAEERLAAYDMMMEYAYFGKEPDLQTLPPVVAALFLLMRPNLDAGRRKAENRLGKVKNKERTNEEQTENKRENKSESKSESESESKSESKCKEEKESLYSNTPPLSPFERFWLAYPRKEGRGEAERVFREVKVPVEVLLRAIAVQRGSPQWQKEGGRYIPSPARWLSQKRWEDRPAEQAPMGTLEMQAIRRIMTGGI